MTKKDYELIADALYKSRSVAIIGKLSHSKMVEVMAEALEIDNPRFNRDMFMLRACVGNNNEG